MRSIDFKESNFTYQPPKGMTVEQCIPLPVCRGTTTENEPVVISCWELSPEELEQINREGKVWLLVTGTGQPPVRLQTETPFS